MPVRRVFNPDDYLWTPEGRIYTEERNAAAWEQMYADLDAILKIAEPAARLYVVMGVQGGGKSTWIRNNCRALGPSAVFMDAAVPARRHRERVLALAQRSSVRTIAVWINTSLDRALLQNAQRPNGEVVPEFAVRSVFGLLQAPSRDEGFDEVIVISDQADDNVTWLHGA
jgi:predicted kinase